MMVTYMENILGVQCRRQRMKIHLYVDNQEIVFGIRYNKNLFMDTEHQLILSFWKWDLEFIW